MFKTGDAIHLGGPARDHHDGHIAPRANFTRELQTVGGAKTEIEGDEIDPIRFQRVEQRRLVFGLDHLEAFRFKTRPQNRANRQFVVDDQNANGCPPLARSIFKTRAANASPSQLRQVYPLIDSTEIRNPQSRRWRRGRPRRIAVAPPPPRTANGRRRTILHNWAPSRHRGVGPHSIWRQESAAYVRNGRAAAVVRLRRAISRS